MPRNRRPSLREMELQCENWNLKYPIGTPVTCLMDSGELRFTKTRSAAQVLSEHTAVIWVEGISGAYLLDRVKTQESPSAA